MGQRIRTLLIDDSAFMRKVVSDIIRTDNDVELVGIAKGGQEGKQMALELKPDVIITDMVMPDYDGVYVVNELMESQPTPIILLSSLEKTDSRIFDALQQGAFEFIDKPKKIDDDIIKNYHLLDLIKQAARTDISLLKAKQLAKKNTYFHSFDHAIFELIVIGASTGGPGAVELLVNNFPANLKIPVVIAQHMPHRFIETFSVRLNENSPIPVVIPRKGEQVRGGKIYLASGESNLRIERNILTQEIIFNYTNKKFEEFNCPSIDCVFESAAETFGGKCIGVILTGMGKDGMLGLKKIRNAGGITIGQDENSCVVYGMPKAAFEYGSVSHVVNLKQIPGFIISCL